jgi:hypothetical protein
VLPEKNSIQFTEGPSFFLRRTAQEGGTVDLVIEVRKLLSDVTEHMIRIRKFVTGAELKGLATPCIGGGMGIALAVARDWHDRRRHWVSRRIFVGRENRSVTKRYG